MFIGVCILLTYIVVVTTNIHVHVHGYFISTIVAYCRSHELHVSYMYNYICALVQIV